MNYPLRVISSQRSAAQNNSQNPVLVKNKGKVLKTQKTQTTTPLQVETKNVQSLDSPKLKPSIPAQNLKETSRKSSNQKPPILLNCERKP